MRKVKDLWEKYWGQKKALVLPDNSSSIARPPQQSLKGKYLDPFEEIAQELVVGRVRGFFSGQSEDIGNMPAHM